MRKLGAALGLAVMCGALGVAATAIASSPKSPARCTTAQLQISFRSVSGGLDHDAVSIQFKNQAENCILGGYPGVDGLSANGQRVFSAERSLSGYLGGLSGNGSIPTVTLAKGQTASAILEWTAGPIKGVSCTKASYVLITPPGALRSVRRPIAFGNAPLCQVQVHPVVAGHSGDGRASQPTNAPSSSTSTPQTCETGQLKVQLYNLQGNAGEESAFIRFTNQGAECSMYKYAGFVPLLANGKQATTKLIRGPLSVASVISKIQRISLKKDSVAWTVVTWPDQCQDYLRPSAFLVTPPNDYVAKRISAKPLYGGGRIAICDDTLTISPVFAKLANPGQT